MSERPRLLAIRHGESRLNELNLDGMTAATIPPGVPLDREAKLTVKGEQQAFELGEVMAEILKITPGYLVPAFCSDFERAVKTMEILVARINAVRQVEDEVGFVIDSRLHEAELGLTEPAYVYEYPEQLGQTFDDYWEARRNVSGARMDVWPVPKVTEKLRKVADELGLERETEIRGERQREAVERVTNWFEDVATQSVVTQSGAKTLVVAHGGVMYALRAPVLGESENEVSRIGEDGSFDLRNCSVCEYELDESGWVVNGWGVKPSSLAI